MFNLEISEDILDYYFSKSFHKLKTGMDKITPAHFEKIKNEQFKIIIRKIKNNKYKFTKLKKIHLPDNRTVYIPTVRDRIVLDYLKDRLNFKYKIQFKNRDKIIEDIKNKLSSPMDFFILRIDIKDFFPSIKQNKLLHKLKRSSILSSNEYHLVKEILKKVEFGIPQGLPISNALSEIYLEEVDFELKRVDQRINYYCRYVDDIIFIINGNLNSRERAELKNKIQTILKTYGLTINKTKTIETPSLGQENIEFEYLGYHFVKSGKKHRLITSISQKKIKKFLEKIDACFNDYIKEKKVNKNDNINLLIERLNFLTKSQFIIKKEKHLNPKTLKQFYKIKKIYTGFFQSYKLVDRCEAEKIAKEIDRYIRKKIFSLRHVITSRNSKRILYSISMYNNYKNNKTIPVCRFTSKEYIRRIKFINPSSKITNLQTMSFNELEKYYFKLLNL
jgi:hypothetical protein